MAQAQELLVGDIRDSRALDSAFSGVDAVMHFAAHAYVGESVIDPRKYFDNNVQGGLLLLNRLLETSIRLLVFSSSCAVYGIPSRVPITEEEFCQPINPYGISKLFFEKALEAYGRAYNLRSVALRYFNAAGADDSGEIGELHTPETHLIPCALRAAAGIDPYLEIYGEDYPTPDGTCIRDFIHVTDLAEAHVLALQHLIKGGASLVCNLGTGSGHSILEVVQAVERVTGLRVPVKKCARRVGDPPVLTADTSLASQVLGWRAERGLMETIASAWAWLQKSKGILSARAAHAD